MRTHNTHSTHNQLRLIACNYVQVGSEIHTPSLMTVVFLSPTHLSLFFDGVFGTHASFLALRGLGKPSVGGRTLCVF